MNIESIKSNLENNSLLNEILIRQYGYFTPDMLTEMIDALGGDFTVILKTYKGTREEISLFELENLEFDDNEKYMDIRECFIESSTYKEIFG